MEPVTTGQGLTDLFTAIGHLGSWQDVLKYLALGLVGLILIPTIKQHLIEMFIAKFQPNGLVKLMMPTAFAAVLGGVLRALGATPDQAMAAAGIWATMTHLVNESPLALDLPAGVKSGLIGFESAAKDAAGSAKVGAFLLVAFLGLGAGLHAATTYDLSLGSPLGSSAWEVVDGGKVVSSGSTLAGSGLVLSYGADDVAGKYTPYIALLGGFGGETRNGDNYFDGFIGAGPVIPGTSTPIVVGPCWRLFTGQQYPAIMVATSIQWGQSLWHK